MEYKLLEKRQDPPFSLSFAFYALVTLNLGIVPFLNRLKAAVFPKMPVLRVLILLLLVAWGAVSMMMVPRLTSFKTKVRGKITITGEVLDIEMEDEFFQIPFDDILSIRIQQLSHRYKTIELAIFTEKLQIENNVRLETAKELKSFQNDLRKLYLASVPIKEQDIRGNKCFLLVANRTFEEIQILKEKYNIDWA